MRSNDDTGCVDVDSDAEREAEAQAERDAHAEELKAREKKLKSLAKRPKDWYKSVYDRCSHCGKHHPPLPPPDVLEAEGSCQRSHCIDYINWV